MHRLREDIRSKLYYRTSDIITPVGGRLVHRLREDIRSKLYYRTSDIITHVGGRLVHRLRTAVLSQPVQRDGHLYAKPRGADRGSTVVKVLCYKSEGRWFDPSWCHWNF